MSSPCKNKIIKPSLEKIEEFKQLEEFTISDSQSILNGLPINVWFDRNVFKFEFDYVFNKPLNEMIEVIDNFFKKGSLYSQKSKYCFQKHSVDNIEINNGSNKVTGELTTFIETDKESFNNNYLRIIIPTPKHSKTGTIEDSVCLKTDQDTEYGLVFNSFEINNKLSLASESF